MRNLKGLGVSLLSLSGQTLSLTHSCSLGSFFSSSKNARSPLSLSLSLPQRPPVVVVVLGPQGGGEGVLCVHECCVCRGVVRAGDVGGFSCLSEVGGEGMRRSHSLKRTLYCGFFLGDLLRATDKMGERVLFIGTQFSNLYTAVDTPARGRVCEDTEPVMCSKVRNIVGFWFCSFTRTRWSYSQKVLRVNKGF